MKIESKNENSILSDLSEYITQIDIRWVFTPFQIYEISFY